MVNIWQGAVMSKGISLFVKISIAYDFPIIGLRVTKEIKNHLIKLLVILWMQNYDIKLVFALLV